MSCPNATGNSDQREFGARRPSCAPAINGTSHVSPLRLSGVIPSLGCCATMHFMSDAVALERRRPEANDVDGLMQSLARGVEPSCLRIPPSTGPAMA